MRSVLGSFLAVVMASAALATAPVHAVATGPDRTDQDDRPNIILFMTDDQNRDELQWMPKTRALLGGHGVTFDRALSPAPLCCPARAMTLTGQYGQNNGVQFNSGPYGGFPAFAHSDNTLATWLQDAGYQTALVGKYLNGYQRDVTPPQAGWTRWNPSVLHIYSYWNTEFLVDGEHQTFTRNVTPVISDFVEDDVRTFAATDAPFFLWVSEVAPHGASAGSTDAGSVLWDPPRPTRRHSQVLGGVRAPALSKPSFDVPGPAPRPYPRRMLRNRPKHRMQAQFTGRVRTLQDVDDAVERLVRVLQETGELEDTYILFVSDNGMLLGEHRLVGKNLLYRDDLEIPLVVRVPGTASGTVSTTPVTIVDLAPTIAELAGVTPGRVEDGRSFAPLLQGQPLAWRDTQLVQAGSARTTGPEPGWQFRGVRTGRYTYMQRPTDGAEFLYDRRSDPYEIVNVARQERYAAVLAELRRRHDLLVDCAGASCDQGFGPMPSPDPARTR